jgi:hypothetical protein
MKLTGFIGGSDVQRSLNLSDNQCINLFPTTNNDGSITGFYKIEGLKQEAVLSGNSNGAYRTSTGRSFYVAYQTLYELNNDLTSTLRGTVTAGNYSFSDNGLEVILVSGVDGWIFTLATNALLKIKVSTGTFTVTLDTQAVFTKAAHGLVAGDRFLISTTGALPTGLLTNTPYFVIASGLTVNTFKVSLTNNGTPVATSGTQSGIHTLTTTGYGFPEGCKTVSYMNGRFVACDPNTQNFYVSEPLAGDYWDALNVQTVDSNPDYVIGQVNSHNEMIVFCETSAEVFYDSGTIPSPFVRNLSGIFEVGCQAPFSIKIMDNSVFWLGQTREGHVIVYRLNGYTPVRISNYGIEQAIEKMSYTADARAFVYQAEGHHFYVLTFPTGNKTFVFDANTNLWHERASFINNAFGMWEPRDILFIGGKHYVTDTTTSNLYSLDVNTFMSGTNYLKVLRSFKSVDSEMQRTIHRKLTLEAEFGTGVIGGTEPDVMLRWSDNGGHTWSDYLVRGLGAVGQYFKRVIWNRLGMTKGPARIYEISSTANAKIVFLNAYLE